MKIGVIGAGQFSGKFVALWQLHPDVDAVHVTDVVPERAEEQVRRHGLAGSFPDAETMLASDCDAVAVMTQRWTHAPLVLQALDAGKHVYSAVPMAISAEEVRAIVDKVAETGLTYMMGETSYYNPAVVHARQRHAEGAFGRVFYAEGDYVHEMSNGFYQAFRHSGGENWKATASFPPMLYPTHSCGGVLGALDTHATSVSCLGIADRHDDGVFDRQLSLWQNDFSNMTALFELADGATMRTNEFRRVGHPARVHESRFRIYGTDAVMEQTSTGASWSTRDDITDISQLFRTTVLEHGARDRAGEAGADIAPALRHSFESGSAEVHDRSRLPRAYDGAPNGHQGSHHFLADDFVRAVVDRTRPPVDVLAAARYTLPGIVALESARQGGARLPIPDLGGTSAPGLDHQLTTKE